MIDVKDVIMHDTKREVLLDLLREGKRLDGRGFYDYRDVSIEVGVIESAEGSAMARIGTTQVLCGVKVELATPFPDKPQEGLLVTNAEFPPLASPTFEAGPPDENSIELARVVDRAIRSSESIDFSSLFLEEDKVLALFVDIYVLDHGGNMMDAAGLAAVAALANTSIPVYEDGQLLRDKVERKLSLATLPVITSFIQLGEFILADPTYEENLAADARISFATTPNYITAVQKTSGGFLKQRLDEVIDLSFEKGEELRQRLKSVIEEVSE